MPGVRWAGPGKENAPEASSSGAAGRTRDRIAVRGVERRAERRVERRGGKGCGEKRLGVWREEPERGVSRDLGPPRARRERGNSLSELMEIYCRVAVSIIASSSWVFVGGRPFKNYIVRRRR
jgi:hypothetical protein